MDEYLSVCPNRKSRCLSIPPTLGQPSTAPECTTFSTLIQKCMISLAMFLALVLIGARPRYAVTLDSKSRLLSNRAHGCASLYQTYARRNHRNQFILQSPSVLFHDGSGNDGMGFGGWASHDVRRGSGPPPRSMPSGGPGFFPGRICYGFVPRAAEGGGVPSPPR